MLSLLHSHTIKLTFISTSSIDGQSQKTVPINGDGGQVEIAIYRVTFCTYVICIFIRSVTSMFSFLYDNEARQSDSDI